MLARKCLTNAHNLLQRQRQDECDWGHSSHCLLEPYGIWGREKGNLREADWSVSPNKLVGKMNLYLVLDVLLTGRPAWKTSAF